jgi:ADP-heptose:LPS heptosyltransferase
MRMIALVPGGIGDQILFFPTLDDLKQSYPDADIDVVVEPRAKSAYRVCKSVSDILTFDFKDRNSPADWANLLGVLRDRYYNVALALGQRSGVGLLLWLTGIPIRVGYGTNAIGRFFLTNPVPLKPDQYAASMYHDLLRGLDINTPTPELAISIPKRDLEWAEVEQKRLGLAGSGYVLIHGGSSQLAQIKGIDKIYPVESWQQIIQDFQQRQPGLPIVVVQGPDDRDFVSALTQSAPALKVTMPGDVGRLAAMIAGANLMLCTDSAPMHLAIALKVFTLALFGPTDPTKLIPVNDKFLSIKSATGKMADIPAKTVLAKVWGEG